VDLRSPRGAGLLLAGTLPDEDGRAAPTARVLGQIGAALVATGTWRVVRLDAGGPAHDAPTLANAARALAVVPDAPVDAVFVIAAGALVTVDAALALASAPDVPPIPLAMLRTLAAAPRVVVVIAAHVADGADADAVVAAALATLAAGRADALVAIAHGPRAVPMLATLRDGLAGGAVDATTGTITGQSLAAHLARATPGIALASSLGPVTLVNSPALTGAWDPRLTRRALAKTIATDEEDLTGAILPGRLRIDAVIARGGFGTVYRARQLAVDRDVAVKVLRADVDPSSPSGRLFVEEIQAVGRIDHPNVVRIHHADVTAEGRLFFAMELLAGRDLERVVREDGVVPAARAAALVRQLVAGLGAAHDAGLVHADIKPANAVIVPSRGGERVVLLDFGLARLRRPGGAVRSMGGTPAYMAPEQLRNGRVDARSDLFAAGLVLVALLTGWRRRTRDDLAPPLELIDDPALRATLARVLAIDPAARFGSAAELEAALAGSHAPEVVASVAPVARVRARVLGRDRELDELVDAALYRRAVALIGGAGAGKTVLVRDGLLPRLTAMGLAASYLTSAPTSRRVSTQGTRRVVILDPAPEPGAVDAALAALAGAADDPDVAVVVCLRDDALPRLGAHGLAGDVVVVRLAGLDGAGVRDALLAPLGSRRIAIDDDAVAAIVAELAGPARAGGCPPTEVVRVARDLEASLGPDEGVVTLAHYRAIAPRQVRERRRFAPWIAAGVVTVGVVAALAVARRGAVSSTAGPPVVTVGGSGTLLWGFFSPLNSFLEDVGRIDIPISSTNDKGSGGALKALHAGTIDIAALSQRLAAEPVTDDEVLVEVAVGFDETSFLVRRDNPIRALDVAAVRAHLCCPVGATTPPLTWRALGIDDPALADHAVTWLAYGRKRVPGPNPTTSATLAQADAWLCAPAVVCPSTIDFQDQANDVAAMVRDRTTLVLSTRAFATDQLAPVTLVDRAHHTHLDGRKVLWLYALVDRGAPISATLCQFFSAALDPAVARRLEAFGKATGLPDAARVRERQALGLDDGSCATVPVGERVRGAGELGDGRLASPIADEIKIEPRWVPDP
jgi:serine/threonine-protein kinase